MANILKEPIAFVEVDEYRRVLFILDDAVFLLEQSMLRSAIKRPLIFD